MINVSDQHHQYAFGRPLRPISMKSDILSQSLYFNFVTKKRNMKLTPNLFGVTSGCHTTTTTNNDCTASGTATCQQGIEGAEVPIGLSLFAIFSLK